MITVGSVRLENPFILAPMAGISDPPFRRLCRRSGAALVCAEMVSANALHFNDAKSLRMLQVFPDETPVSMQVFGAEPERLAEAARRAEDAGAAIVDLNCGCPVRKITGTGAGIGLMEDEEKFARCLESMVRAVKVPVTVKIRLGRVVGENRGPRFARRAESVGVSAISVHARAMESRHSGPPDLLALKEVVEAVKIPVFGNGGVRSYEDARRMMRETGCAGVMIGQAAVGNPLIFGDFLAQDRSLAPRRSTFDLLLEHARLNADYYGEELGIVRLRKCLASYIRDVPQAAQVRSRAYSLRSLEDLSRLIEEYH